jgi:starch phosphorylase
MPNPDETEMVNAWNSALALSETMANIVVLPGYDLRLSKLLKQGSDLWVNSPAVPNEACGTSGMGAALNMTPSLSTPDGWMAEADPENHFIFGYHAEHGWDEQWRHDAGGLRGQLMTAMSMYYDDLESWYEKALGAKREAEGIFTGRRMMAQYAKLYEALGQ